eukprot:3940491-Rhodomonas_salina.5
MFRPSMHVGLGFDRGVCAWLRCGFDGRMDANAALCRTEKRGSWAEKVEFGTGKRMRGTEKGVCVDCDARFWHAAWDEQRACEAMRGTELGCADE